MLAQSNCKLTSRKVRQNEGDDKESLDISFNQVSCFINIKFEREIVPEVR